MGAVYVRDLSDETIAAMKERAARNGRSMQKELHEVIENAAAEPLPRRRRGPLNIVTVNTGNTGSWDRGDIYDY
jgi:plasmid stability protein